MTLSVCRFDKPPIFLIKKNRDVGVRSGEPLKPLTHIGVAAIVDDNNTIGIVGMLENAVDAPGE